MLKKNSIWLGIFCGLVFPLIAFVFTKMVIDDLRSFGKEYLLYIIGISFNLIMLRYYFKTDKQNTASGIMLVTFVSVFIFFFFKNGQ